MKRKHRGGRPLTAAAATLFSRSESGKTGGRVVNASRATLCARRPRDERARRGFEPLGAVEQPADSVDEPAAAGRGDAGTSTAVRRYVSLSRHS